MREVEVVQHGERVLAYIIPAEVSPARTEFVTRDDENMQLGFVVYPAGGEVAPHAHLPVARAVQGTTEVILVRSGSCTLDLYDDNDTLLTSRRLEAGDCVYLASGGHGFRMEEDTVLLEVKQGPYLAVEEKRRFDPRQ